MANEITVNGALRVLKGDLDYRFSTGSLQFNMSGDAASGGVQAIGTSAHEALTINTTDLTSAGWCYFRNLDATNYVDLGIDDGGTFEAFGRLYPGEFAFIPLATTAPYAKANSASVNLQYHMTER